MAVLLQIVSLMLVVVGAAASHTSSVHHVAARGGRDGSAAINTATPPRIGTEQLVYTQLLHRHGARYPLAKANASYWCPKGCGVLLDEGKDMLVQLGRLVKARYSDYYSFGDRYVDVLNRGAITTRSTAVPRTLQSADGMLRGLFPDIAAYYPVVNNQALGTDGLLSAGAWPAFTLWTAYMKKTGQFQALMAPVVKAQFPDVSVLVGLAAEAHYDAYCAKLSYDTVCVGAIHDIAASLNAQGKLDAAAYPLMLAYYNQLGNVRRAMRALTYRYDPSGYPQLDGARGAWQTLAQQYLANMRAVIDNPSQQGAPSLMHYSAHDDTTGPFSAVIGDGNQLPPFAQMYLIDLVADNGLYYVRGVQGAPSQVPGAHAYSTSPLQLGGIDASGKVYHLQNATDRMPLDDFARFVDSSRGTSGLGVCYVEPIVVSTMGCDAVGTVPSAECLAYRSNCPDTACPAGTWLRYADYACVTTNPNADDAAEM